MTMQALAGLDRLAEEPDRQVILHASSADADAGARLIPACVHVAFDGHQREADLSPVACRSVVIAPMADQSLVAGLAQQLFAVGVAKLTVIRPIAPGWTLASAEEMGWDSQRTIVEMQTRKIVLSRDPESLDPADMSAEEREAFETEGTDAPAPALSVADERRAKVMGIFDSAAEVASKTPAKRNRHVIELRAGKLSEHATLGERAIIAEGMSVYGRGQSLVRPIVEDVEASDGRRTKVAQLVRIEANYMRDLLCRCADWVKFNVRKNENVPTDPPFDVAQVILHRYGEWQFPSVAGVMTTPTMRPDGSLLLTEGYDSATRLILMHPPEMPPIPESPTYEDGCRTLALLDGLLKEFPFADAASRSVALSALITPVVRGAFAVTPMHVMSAPSPGSGKSFLLDIAAAIALGQPCPVMSAGENEAETEKRLGAALLAGQPIISIDNLNGDLGGDALCQIIERPVVEIRVLGKSERVRIEARSSLFATGNNIRMVGDMVRRVLRCRLDSNLERPELRQFGSNPVKAVLSDRGRYIAAALTVVRAYVIAGKPGQAPRLASFEGWSDTVRSALIWLGKHDPVETMKAAREEDPQLQTMSAVFSALRDAIGVGSDRTVAKVIEIGCARFPDYDVDGSPHEKAGAWKQPQLHDALMSVANRGGFIDAKTLGKWFSSHKHRIANGVRLDGQSDIHGHAARWWVTDVSGAGTG
jgi:hypothetical protein